MKHKKEGKTMGKDDKGLKTAMWVCQKCKNETPQPREVGDKFVECCPACGEIHTVLREIDASHTEFVVAEGWFKDDYTKRLGEIQQRDYKLQNTVEQMLQLQYDIVPELRDLVKNIQNQMKVAMEQGIRRHKLSKRTDMKWGYNHIIGKWIGRRKADKPI